MLSNRSVSSASQMSTFVLNRWRGVRLAALHQACALVLGHRSIARFRQEVNNVEREQGYVAPTVSARGLAPFANRQQDQLHHLGLPRLRQLICSVLYLIYFARMSCRSLFARSFVFPLARLDLIARGHPFVNKIFWKMRRPKSSRLL